MALLQRPRQLLRRAIAPQNPGSPDAWREQLLFAFLNLLIVTSVLTFLHDVFTDLVQGLFGFLGVVITVVARVVAQYRPKAAGWFLVISGTLFVYFALDHIVLTTQGGITLSLLVFLSSIFIASWVGFLVAIVIFLGVLPLNVSTVGLAVGLGGAVWLITASLESALRRYHDNAIQLQQSNDELRAIQATLENRVAERTQELSQARDEALAATRAKSVFLANMSHELRTPLTIIIGYSDMLQREAGGRGDPTTMTKLGKIRSSADHLLEMISNILDLSKIEAGKMELRLESFAMSELLTEVAADVQPLIARNGNVLAVDWPDNLGIIYADLGRVRQILLNLLSNTAKFTYEGTITLAAAREVMEGADWLILRVSDTGLGIPHELQAQLFQPFVQVDEPDRANVGGTGLGLSITRDFCRMMGGDISLSSEGVAGKGSTFTVVLPVEVRKPTTSPAPIQNGEEAGSHTPLYENERV
jgi:signal transduction histidine kinase